MPDDAPWAEPVVVPDDLRSLQADIDAYHRELRLAGRRRWVTRITTSGLWRRFAVPVAVVAGASLAAAVVFTALTLGRPTGQPPAVPGPLATDARAAVGQTHGLLPDVRVATSVGSASIRDLRPALLALVPLHCSCPEVLAGLAAQADEARLKLVAVAPASVDAEVAALPGQLHRGRVEAVFDAAGSLAETYGATDLTVLGVAADGTVGFVHRDVGAGSVRLESELLELVAPVVATAGH